MLKNIFWSIPRGKSYLHINDLLLATFHSILFKTSESYVKKFEDEICKIYQAKSSFSFSSCRAALYSLLQCVDLEKESEVLLTPITIPDVVNAVRLAGYKPVFVDLDPDTQNVDINDLQKKISKRTSMILITHLAGIVPNLKPVVDYLREKGLFIIEDISQNYLSTSDGELIGTFGDAAIGSICTTKTICSMVGGVLLINDTKVAERFNDVHRPPLLQYCDRTFRKLLWKEVQIEIFTNRVIFSFFTYPCFFMLKMFFARYFKKSSDLNFRTRRKNSGEAYPFYENVPILREEMPKDIEFSLNEFQGVLAYRSLLRADRGQKKRRCLALVLFSEFDDVVVSALPSSLSKIEENGFWHFPIYVGNKSQFNDYLFSNGIDVVGSTLQLCSQIDEFKEFRAETTGAQYIFDYNIFLPIHDKYTVYDMKRVARVVNEYFRVVI